MMRIPPLLCRIRAIAKPGGSVRDDGIATPHHFRGRDARHGTHHQPLKGNPMHKYLAAVAAALLLTISPAFAGSATGTMTVTATVPSDCVFGSMSLPFSSYDSVGLEATVP